MNKMKLKTLKDFKEKKCKELSPWNCDRIDSKDLRKEAIKWIKEFQIGCPDEEEILLNDDFKNIRPMIKELMKYKKDRGMSEFDFKIISIFIKHFFNITEEDCKEVKDGKEKN